MWDDRFLPRPPVDPGDREDTVQLDPLLEQRWERHAWKVRSAQWRAMALAEEAFGAGVSATLTGRGGYDGFRGLLTLSVPFRNMEDHRYRESLFLSWAAQDLVLTRVPLVFLFHPEPVGAV